MRKTTAILILLAIVLSGIYYPVDLERKGIESTSTTSNDSRTSAPVANWTFDEGSGTILHDYSGNNNNGTLVNGPTWVAGISGTAVNFDGINDYVDIPNSATIDVGTEDFAISLWFKLDSMPSYVTNAYELFGKYQPGYGFYELQVMYTGNLMFAMGSNSGFKSVFTESQVTSGIWYNAVVMRSNNVASIFLNGVFEASFASSYNVLLSDFAHAGKGWI